MPPRDYESLGVFWSTYEQGIRAKAAAEDDPVDENVTSMMKTMYYLGAYHVLRILNKAGLVHEGQVSVVNLLQEIGAVTIEFPDDLEDADDVH